MATDEKKSIYREDFPGYNGHIPYKYSIIGKTIGATNDTIKHLLTAEPPKEASMLPSKSTDFSYYNKDYYNADFNRDYPLEEEKIFSNRSKDAQTWIKGDKYKIYPQQIPGNQTYVPAIYPANIHGMTYSKATAKAIKGDYLKDADIPSNERFKSSNMEYYGRPKIRSDAEMRELEANNGNYRYTLKGQYGDEGRKFYNDIRRIYHSKIAQVPTVGYCGTQSIFQKVISYLNYDKIMEQEKKEKYGVGFKEAEGLPPKFIESLQSVKPDVDVPYIVGYKGFRTSVKSENVHGENFHNASLEGRNIAKMRYYN